MASLVYTSDQGYTITFGQTAPYWLTGVEGLAEVPSVISTIKSPSQDGVTVTGSSLEPRHITLIGELVSDGQSSRTHLIKTMNPKIKGTLVYTNGEFQREIICQPERVPLIGGHTRATSPFIVNLLCADPYWKALDEIREDIAAWIGSFSFPLELLSTGIEMGYRVISLNKNVINTGDVPCGLRIEFKAIADVENPILTNVTTGEFFKLNKTLAGGEIITVTTHFLNKTVSLESGGVISNAFQYIDLTSIFFDLEVGDNLLTYGADSGIDNLEVSIWFTPRYLGV